MKKLALLVIGLMLFGLAKPVSAASGYVLWLHSDGSGYPPWVDHYKPTPFSNFATFSVAWEITVRNVNSSKIRLMTVGVEDIKGNDYTSTFWLEKDGNEYKLIAMQTGPVFKESDNLIGYCDPTKEWCRLSIVIHKDGTIEYSVKGPEGQKIIDVTEPNEIKEVDFIQAALSSDGKFDMYIDNIVEKHGDKTVTTEDFEDGKDDYFYHFNEDGNISVTDKFPKGGASGGSSGGHSFDIPPGVILLLAVAALALRRE